MIKAFLSKLALVASVLSLGSSAAQATAFTIDATLVGDTETINGALWNQSQVSSGSGAYTSLFRVQRSGTEAGYNDFSGVNPFDQVGGVGVLQVDLKDLAVVNIGGVNYVELHFDANNANNLVFTDFRVFLHSDPTDADVAVTAVTVESGINATSFGPLAYDMLGTNIGGANTLTITAFPSGSGTDNMTINIPLSNFTSIPGWNLNDDVYIWVKMTGAQAGFEEFAYLQGVPTVGTLTPEAHTIWGGGAMVASLLVGGMIRRRKSQVAVAS